MGAARSLLKVGRPRLIHESMGLEVSAWPNVMRKHHI